MNTRKNGGLVFVSLALGLAAVTAPFTYFLMTLIFLAIPGLTLAVLAWRRHRTVLSVISLTVNLLAGVLLIYFVIGINRAQHVL